MCNSSANPNSGISNAIYINFKEVSVYSMKECDHAKDFTIHVILLEQSFKQSWRFQKEINKASMSELQIHGSNTEHVD